MQQYKTISINLPDEVTPDFQTLEKLFNQDFKREDIFLDLSPTECLVNVRQVDMRELRLAIDRLIEAYDQRGAETVLREALLAIEAIGSYGLRGGKRVFVGYNNERKVEHRRDKEKRRGRHYYANDHTFRRETREPPARFVDRILCGDSEPCPT